jgi:hypothetical protein
MLSPHNHNKKKKTVHCNRVQINFPAIKTNLKKTKGENAEGRGQRGEEKQAGKNF